MWLVGFRYVFGKNCGWNLYVSKNMYKMFGGSVVAVVFQNAFYLEMYQNIFFYFLKIIFDISASKWSENTKNISIWSKEKEFKIFKNAFETQKHTDFYETQLKKHAKTTF